MTQLLAAIVIFLYPVTVLAVPKANGLIFGVCVIIGIWLSIKHFRRHLHPSKYERLLYFAVVSFFLVSQLATLVNGLDYGATGKFLHLLLIIPAYIYFKHSRLNIKSLWYGLIAGAIITVFIAGYDLLITHEQRARGITHPIIFGDLALIMGAMALASYGHFINKPNHLKALPIIALSFASISSVLSMSRGAWVAIPLLVIAFIWYAHKHIKLKNLAIISVLAISALSITYVIPQTGVSARLHTTIKNINKYNQSKIDSPDRATSIGARFEMWQAAWQIYTDNPVLGVGWGNYKSEAQKLVDQGIRNPAAALYPHPHNQFLSNMVNGGTLGLLAILLLLSAPAWIFYSNIKHASNPDIQRVAFAGLLLIIGYGCFGLSEAILERSRPVNFLAFYIAVFMAFISKQKAT